jgi:uncharacterized membrane protein SpoIIM required for sporulation
MNMMTEFYLTLGVVPISGILASFIITFITRMLKRRKLEKEGNIQDRKELGCKIAFWKNFTKIFLLYMLGAIISCLIILYTFFVKT